MKTFILGLLLLMLLLAISVLGAQPPFHVDDPAIQSDFEEIYEKLSTHQHNNDGSVTITTSSSTFTAVTVTTLTVTNLVTTYPTSFRNKVINGDMDVSQRFVNASTRPVAGTSTYPIDRFALTYTTPNKFTAQRVADGPTGYQYSLKLTVSAGLAVAASQLTTLETRIEGYDVDGLAFGSASASPMTLSFWVKCSSAGVFGLSFVNATKARAYPTTYTIDAAATWEQKTITFTGDTTGTWAVDSTTGIAVRWAMGAGSTFEGTAGAWTGSNIAGTSGDFDVIASTGVTWQITGVQLEQGGAATPFERPPFQTRLARCQRYYEKSYDLDTALGTVTNVGTFTGQRNATNFTSTVIFRVTKNNDPTVTVYSNATGAKNRVRNNTTAADETANPNSIGTNECNVAGTTATADESIAFQWESDAEL